MICPAQVLPAPPSGTTGSLGTIGACYTSVYNLLDFPAGVVPVTRVTQQDDDDLSGYPEDDMWTRDVKKVAKGAVGLPIGVQVVTQPFRDELCLRLMRDVEGNVNYQRPRL